MSKVICDVCGTAYPETAALCPICGSAKASGDQTAAGEAVQNPTGDSSYAYVKGGRFSKRNVRRRGQGSRTPERRTTASRQVREETSDPANKGLVIAIIVLLLAIISVVIYIGVRFFLPDLGNKEPAGDPTGTAAPSISQTQGPTVPCTKLALIDQTIALGKVGDDWKLRVETEPADMTDELVFVSADESVATVTADGTIEAVGNGQTTITVTCGQFMAECTVICTIAGTTDPTEQPTEPTNPLNPAFEFAFDAAEKYRDPVTGYDDTTIEGIGNTWKCYKKLNVEPTDVTWSSDDPTICTIDENGIVTIVKQGTTKIHAQYGNQIFTCIVRCRGGEGQTDTPAPDATVFAFNAADEYYKNGKWDTSLKLSEQTTWRAYRNGTQLKPEDMKWSVKDTSICTVDDKGMVTLLTPGTTEVYAEHDGTTYTCIVRVYS